MLQFALMGASYSRNGFAVKRPRVGLLNVGTEEHKGRAELKAAHDLIKESAESGQFEFVGFVEGGDIPSDRVDVIVTDGFQYLVCLMICMPIIANHGNNDVHECNYRLHPKLSE